MIGDDIKKIFHIHFYLNIIKNLIRMHKNLFRTFWNSFFFKFGQKKPVNGIMLGEYGCSDLDFEAPRVENVMVHFPYSIPIFWAIREVPKCRKSKSSFKWKKCILSFIEWKKLAQSFIPKKYVLSALAITITDRFWVWEIVSR